MTLTELNVLVVSDLHAHCDTPEGSKPSWISSDPRYQDPKYNPLTGISDFLKKQGHRVDWILCPGDFAHQADPIALDYVWRQLHILRDNVGAKTLIGTIGNHDIDSRRKNPDFDPKGTLQALVPMFPGLTEQDCDYYWSRNINRFVDKKHAARIIIVNSCAFHGIVSDTSGAAHLNVEEYTRGKISPNTLGRIEQFANESEERINILMVHHHPIQYPNFDDGASVMRKGNELVSILEHSRKRWLVLHGHLH